MRFHPLKVAAMDFPTKVGSVQEVLLVKTVAGLDEEIQFLVSIIYDICMKFNPVVDTKRTW